VSFFILKKIVTKTIAYPGKGVVHYAWEVNYSRGGADEMKKKGLLEEVHWNVWELYFDERVISQERKQPEIFHSMERAMYEMKEAGEVTIDVTILDQMESWLQELDIEFYKLPISAGVYELGILT
jgi:hypothetical protein